MSVESGQCSATADRADGKFTPKDGGILKLEDRDDIRLFIPPWALEKTEYMSMQLLEEHETKNSISFSPRVECGPNGLTFNVSIISKTVLKEHPKHHSTSLLKVNKINISNVPKKTRIKLTKEFEPNWKLELLDST